MPPDLSAELRKGLPELSFNFGIMIDGMVLGGGTLGPANRIAGMLGVSSRFALARQLHRDGLPSMRELGSWITLLGLLLRAEQTDEALFTIATRSHRCPAACYRLVRRLTGLTWTALRAKGSDWLLDRLERRCRAIRRRFAPRSCG